MPDHVDAVSDIADLDSAKELQLMAHRITASISVDTLSTSSRSERDRLLILIVFGLLAATTRIPLELHNDLIAGYSPASPAVLPIGIATVLLYLTASSTSLFLSDYRRWNSSFGDLMAQYRELSYIVVSSISRRRTAIEMISTKAETCEGIIDLMDLSSEKDELEDQCEYILNSYNIANTTLFRSVKVAKTTVFCISFLPAIIGGCVVGLLLYVAAQQNATPSKIIDAVPAVHKPSVAPKP